MVQNKTGYLTARVSTAGGALPIEGALVRIKGAEEVNETVNYSRITDNDGIVLRIPLPTASASLSQSPNPAESPYSLYNVEIARDGFFLKKLYNVAIFENIETILPVNLIPRDMSENESYYPRGSINTIIKESENPV